MLLTQEAKWRWLQNSITALSRSLMQILSAGCWCLVIKISMHCCELGQKVLICVTNGAGVSSSPN